MSAMAMTEAPASISSGTATAALASRGSRHVGEGLDGARDVVERREERLRRVGRGAGEEADPPAAPAVVEELHRAGGLGADDVEPDDVVPKLDRQRRTRASVSLCAGREGEGHIADARGPEVAGADEAGGRQRPACSG